MEEDIKEVEDCIEIIKGNCLNKYLDKQNCDKCEIEHICSKYFTREPRRWK